MNHASENGMSEDKKDVIDFLHSEQIDVGIRIIQDEMKLGYGKIKKLITDGLEIKTVWGQWKISKREFSSPQLAAGSFFLVLTHHNFAVGVLFISRKINLIL